MDKKNFDFNSAAGINKTKEWTPPVYHKGKENYVDFYAFDPSRGCMRRKKRLPWTNKEVCLKVPLHRPTHGV